MWKWQNVVRVSSTELEEFLVNDCDEAAIDYLDDGRGPPVLELSGKSAARKEDGGPAKLGESNPHHKKCGVKRRQCRGD